MSSEQTSQRPRQKFWWLTIGVALIFSAGLIAMTLIWLPELPDPIAAHWSSNTPDNFANVWFIVALIVVINLAFAIFSYLAGKSSKNKHSLGAGAKILGALSMWLVTLLTLGVGYSIFIQRGVLDATTVHNGDQVGLGLLASAAIGLVLAAIAWFMIPKDALINADQPQSVAPRTVHDTETVSLVEDLPTPIWLQLSIAAVAVFTTGILWLSTGNFVITLITGLILFTVMAGLNVKIIVSNRGLKVASLLGFAIHRIPLSDIERVGISDIDPMAEFGGWGYRIGFDGRYGVVVQKGPALNITRKSNQKTFVATMEHPQEAAALIGGLLERFQRETQSQTDPEPEQNS